MEKFFARWAANALGLFAAAQLPGPWGLHFQAGATSYLPGTPLPEWSVVLVAALVLALANTFVRPLVMAFTCLINLLTMGLFTLVVNAAMVFVTSWALDQVLKAGFVSLSATGILAALVAAVIVGILNSIFNRVF